MKRTARLQKLCVSAMAALALPCLGAVPDHDAHGDGFVHHLAERINAYRQHNGLDPLSFAMELVTIADAHSAGMAAQHRLSHEGFMARFRFASSRLCVENVAVGFPTPDKLLEGWRRSPAHRINLLDPKISRMGIAVSTRYVTFFACQ